MYINIFVLSGILYCFCFKSFIPIFSDWYFFIICIYFYLCIHTHNAGKGKEINMLNRINIVKAKMSVRLKSYGLCLRDLNLFSCAMLSASCGICFSELKKRLSSVLYETCQNVAVRNIWVPCCYNWNLFMKEEILLEKKIWIYLLKQIWEINWKVRVLFLKCH